MDQQIRKLQNYLKKYFGSSKSQILTEWGNPLDSVDENLWFYSKRRFLIFKDEICFFFKNGKVDDIVITEYCLGTPMRNIFFSKGEKPSITILPVKI